MKTDVLTFAALVFVVGLLVSSLLSSELFESSEAEPPAELQQGVAFH
ncbi:hypothetical protein TDB9533_01918 [Thalassocella blandensis]|nr:hypothetical protein TDB9533_01918 [Thalassocella blandensis]